MPPGPKQPAQPNPARDAAVDVVRTLRYAGFTAYLAGGCVRDELLGLIPKDYDVATDATPDRVQKLFAHTSAVGAAFGVILIHAKPGSKAGAVEVATFREDGDYSDRRRPDSVRFSDARTDAERRDFTINALFRDPLAPDGDGVIDFIGGRADLAAGVVRAVGDPEARLAEDHLRALRAVRFSARFGFTIEDATARAIRAHAGDLAGVSRERIGDELRRMLAHPARDAAVRTLCHLGLDGPVLAGSPSGQPTPVLAALRADAAFTEALAAWAVDRHSDDRGLSKRALDEPARESLVARWAGALLLSNEERAALAGTLAALAVLLDGWELLSIAGRKRLAAGPRYQGAQAVLSAIDGDRAKDVATDVSTLANDGIGLAPVPLIDGNDLIELGFSPGPGFARVLAAVYDRQLEGELSTNAEGIACARELWPTLSVKAEG
ncbi:MAG: CCA tRNA nucleotidyltransferase [Planctomycetota bacterium]